MVKLINAGELAEAQEHIAHLEASYDRQTAGMRHHIERADKAEESMKVEQAAHREMSAVAAERARSTNGLKGLANIGPPARRISDVRKITRAPW